MAMPFRSPRMAVMDPTSIDTACFGEITSGRREGDACVNVGGTAAGRPGPAPAQAARLSLISSWRICASRNVVRIRTTTQPGSS